MSIRKKLFELGGRRLCGCAPVFWRKLTPYLTGLVRLNEEFSGAATSMFSCLMSRGPKPGRLLLAAICIASASCSCSFYVSPSQSSHKQAVATVDSYIKRNCGGWKSSRVGASDDDFSYVDPNGVSRNVTFATGRSSTSKYSDISNVKVFSSPAAAVVMAFAIIADPTMHSGIEIKFKDGTESQIGGSGIGYPGSGGSLYDWLPFYFFKSELQHATAAAKALLQLRDEHIRGTTKSGTNSPSTPH